MHTSYHAHLPRFFIFRKFGCKIDWNLTNNFDFLEKKSLKIWRRKNPVKIYSAKNYSLNPIPYGLQYNWFPMGGPYGPPYLKSVKNEEGGWNFVRLQSNVSTFRKYYSIPCDVNIFCWRQHFWRHSMYRKMMYDVIKWRHAVGFSPNLQKILTLLISNYCPNIKSFGPFWG